MCIFLTLASNRPLPLVERGPASPHFGVTGVAEEFVAKLEGKTSLAHLYNVESHEGCACGFQSGPSWEPGDDQSNALAARRALALYTRARLDEGCELQYIACWDGDEHLPVKHERVLDPRDFLKDDFEFDSLECGAIRFT